MLTGQVGQSYLDQLKAHGVAWIYGGENSIDLRHVLDRLSSKWHVRRLMVAGGGRCDWSLARENLLDELSLVVALVASVRTFSGSVCIEPTILVSHTDLLSLSSFTPSWDGQVGIHVTASCQTTQVVLGSRRLFP